ncbi:MAG: protein kinase [Acidobacteriota bacterium]|nr:protein kinase [Acidobacteriota bacterium]
MSARWQQVKKIFQSALERSSDEREQFLDKVCGDDKSLRREVETLLASSENVGSFMEQPAIGEVAEMFVSADNNLQISESLNHYRILSHLGAGGMGEVYLAEDTKLNRFVALKLLPQSLSSDQDANRRLLREARAAATLDHPHICQIHEIAEADGCSFIVMQFCDGETLAEKLERETLNLRETLDLAIQIADALANAHSHHIIHRDIKPANIIVNNKGQAKILDFGLAKIIAENPNVESEAETSKLLSAPNMIIGTAPYMSPEQVRGKPLDARTDIFSFGASLYEMLSGKQLFSRESRAETISAILNYEPPIAKTLADTPPELQRIVRKSLAKDKEKRYQTAKDLVVDLKDARQELEFQNKFGVPPTVGSTESRATQILEINPTEKNQTPEDGTPYTKRAFIFGAVILLAAIGFGYWFFLNRISNTKQIESIAVMPFVNVAADPEVEYLSDGISESLIDRLSQLSQLKVIARSSSFKYRGESIDVQDVANKLGVQAIIMGKVVRRGDNLTVRVEMVDVRENRQLWSEQYNRRAADALSVQEEIAQMVAEKLRLRLSGAQEQQLARRQTASPQAYELLLKGHFYRNKTGTENAKKAAEYYQQAIAVDPAYAPAYAALSVSYSDLVHASILDPKEFTPKAEAAVRKALELDESLAEAHDALALLKLNDWDWAAAEQEYQRAIELNPNLAKAHAGYAFYLSLVGRHEQAIAGVNRARDMNPLSPAVNASVGYSLLLARRYDQALETLKKALELERNNPFTNGILAHTYMGKEMYAEAIAAYQRVIELGGEPGYRIYLGAAYAKSGERGRAQAILKRLETSGSYVSPGELAILYAALGEQEQAFESLERAYAMRDAQLQFLRVEPAFDPLRSDPRFQDLLRRVGLSP